MAANAAGFDAIVVGAGITGCEAAWRCARGGLRVLLVTTSLDTSYNLARDEESLDPPANSLMAVLAPAVTDDSGATGNFALHRAVKRTLEFEPGLHTLQSTVAGLLVEDERVVGVRTWEGVDRRAEATALCVGSFLRARLTIGEVVEQQGRLSEMAYDDLYDDLALRGFEFVTERFSVGGVAGALPYEVTTPVFAADEFLPPRYASRRLSGLYAAGACVSAAPSSAVDSAGPPGYEAAARHGMALGDSLVAAVGSRAG